MANSDDFPRLPSVDRVLARLAPATMVPQSRRAHIVASVRDHLATLRDRIRQGDPPTDAECHPDAVARAAMARAASRLEGSLRPVVNLTGIVLHTNLGRAPLAPVWLDEARDRVAGYCNLEFDIDARRRGSRNDHAADLLRRVVPQAEAALVVNNCAAAVLLTLTALARGREVVVSRGELVEIGGGFRVPEVMAASGARLVEVGTTNRTRLADFEAAIGPDTALLFKAHRSNFRMTGFVQDVDIGQMATLAHRHALPAVFDLGSGRVSPQGIAAAEGEPGPRDILAAGADLVCISGDKLLGGPQAGIILGREAWVEPLRTHPLMRALRVDKLTLAVLEAVLRRHLSGDLDRIPALAALRLSPQGVRRRCVALVRRLRQAGLPEGLHLDIVPTRAETGGGTLPATPLPSYGVAIRLDGVPEDVVDARLRAGGPPVVGRVQDGAVVLDLRTLLPGQQGVVARAILALAGNPGFHPAPASGIDTDDPR